MMVEMNQSLQSTKSASSSEKVRDPQTYEKATAIERALLFNFGTIHLEYHRLILSPKHHWKDISDRT